MQVQKEHSKKQARIEKQEDEATNGDGVVSMKTHEKKLMEQFACKREYGCKT